MNDKASTLPLFKGQAYHNWRTLDGVRLHVVRIAEDYIAKIAYFPGREPVNDDDARSYVGFRRRESELQQKAYDSGIRVPKSEGMFNLAFDEDWNLKPRTPRMITPGIVMGYLQGIKLSEVHSYVETKKDLTTIMKLFREEVRKAERAGFKTQDAKPHNALWNPQEGRVYLIDLELWKHPEVNNDY